MMQVGPTFFSSGGVLNASNTGFLNNMETLNGGSTGLVSTYGPNLMFNGTAAQSTAEKKFGSSSVYSPGGGSYSIASGISLALGTKAWRFEGWFKSTNTFGNLFTVRGVRSFSISSNGAGSNWTYNIASLRGSGGGSLFAATAVVPPNGFWYHFAVQQYPSSYIYFFCNGQVVGALGTQNGVHFNTGDLTIIEIPVASGGVPVYFDDILFRNFTGEEEALLYNPGNGFSTPYTVPTAPFF